MKLSIKTTDGVLTDIDGDNIDENVFENLRMSLYNYRKSWFKRDGTFTLITKKLSIPTIGIGAGIGCDGQVQVINDVLGSFADFVPKHAKQYAKLADIIKNAVTEYHNEVKAGSFPTDKQSFSMDESIFTELTK